MIDPLDALSLARAREGKTKRRAVGVPPVDTVKQVSNQPEGGKANEVPSGRYTELADPIPESAAVDTAADTPTGEYHLLGPPGTGKTTALTRTWVPRAVEAFGGEGVAVCSMTRAAAREIASRGTAGLPFDQVGTLHSFAKRALSQDPFFGDVALAQDARRLEQWNGEVAQEDPRLALSGASSRDLDSAAGAPSALKADSQSLTGDEALRQIECWRHRCEDLDQLPRELRTFWDAWVAWKVDNDLLDFTDLIAKTIEGGHPPPRHVDTGKPMRALFVDEAQDCSALEMRLVRAWAKQVEMVVLSGDPNQSIYRFRGADAHAFHDPATFPADRTYTLKRSYRLPRRVQEHAEDFLRLANTRVPITYSAQDASGEVSREEGFTLAPRVARVELPPRLIRELDALAHEEGDHRRVMVLAPSGYMLDPLLKGLRQAGVLFCNPYKADNGKWNPLRSATRHIVGLFRGPCPELVGEGDIEAGGRPPRLWTWQELSDWTEVCRQKGLLVRGTRKTRIERMTKKQPRGVCEESDLREIFEDWPQIRDTLLPMLQDRSRHKEALAWLRTNMNAAPLKRLEYALTVADRDVATLMEEPRVIVGTIHSVKGGTAGTVFLSPELSTKQKEGIGSSEGFDEMVRLFYVGMTRASRRLVLLGPSRKSKKAGRYMHL